MYMDFAGILFLLTLVSGMIWLFDRLYFAKKREGKAGWFVETCVSLFPVFLIVFMIRTFIAEPYRIPSGSMKPTLVEGDFILVSKFKYGWYFPVLNVRANPFSQIQRGDVVVFRYPPDPKVVFIKRVIGLPGDKIVYVNKNLFINGELVPKEYLQTTYTDALDGKPYMVREFVETLPDNVEHDIYTRNMPGYEFDGVVPEGHYFAMGDNRDDSGDSRVWGFVPDHYVKGKAEYVLISLNQKSFKPRFDRFGERIE